MKKCKEKVRNEALGSKGNGRIDTFLEPSIVVVVVVVVLDIVFCSVDSI